ncbi:hypothetical protein MXD63_27265 [Frankia sp. Cpl3]|uniref:DUF6624 domain-containing protein n=1 Tax=Parafrankia colletiae TaxID=573497 RepID=UPI000AB4171E|nr:DUF6624 domain-containing protein [Parafrankia colletiae]MCK9903738.1 hypothetical protein [Frankia sp. Cpl3]
MELARRVEADQAMRRAWPTRPGDGADEGELTRFGAVDEDNTAWLRRVVAEHGWPDTSLVGEEGAHNAWLLAQHADHDPVFQAECLDLLAAAVECGTASPADLAYLTDRVRRAHGDLQLYGTQFWYGADGLGELQPQPIAEPDRLDERRAAAGLGPFDEYRALMMNMHG